MIDVTSSDEKRSRATGLVRSIRSGEYSDEQCAAMIDDLGILIPYPAWLDLMFHHEPPLSDDEVVAAAMSYRPFAL